MIKFDVATDSVSAAVSVLSIDNFPVFVSIHNIIAVDYVTFYFDHPTAIYCLYYVTASSSVVSVAILSVF